MMDALRPTCWGKLYSLFTHGGVQPLHYDIDVQISGCDEANKSRLVVVVVVFVFVVVVWDW